MHVSYLFTNNKFNMLTTPTGSYREERKIRALSMAGVWHRTNSRHSSGWLTIKSLSKYGLIHCSKNGNT